MSAIAGHHGASKAHFLLQAVGGHNHGASEVVILGVRPAEVLDVDQEEE